MDRALHVGMSRIADVTIKLRVRPMYCIVKFPGSEFRHVMRGPIEETDVRIMGESCEWKKASTTPIFVDPLF